MKLRIYSDLHLEFADFQPPCQTDDADSVLVLAGDIWTAGRACLPLMQWSTHFRAGLLVLGNHDFYGSSIDVVPDQVRENLASAHRGNATNAHLLDNTSVVIADPATESETAFIGATLWTAYQSDESMETDPWFARLAESNIADFRHIVEGPLYSEDTKPLRADRLVREYQRSLAYLASEIRRQREAGREVVVITHHVPSYALGDPFYRGDMLSPAFCSHALDSLAPDALPDLWIFGHQHYSLATTHRGVRCVSNARGYPGERTGFDEQGLGIELGHPTPRPPLDTLRR